MNNSIHFYIRTDRPNKDGSAPICLLFLLNRTQRLRINTGKYISLKKEYQKLNVEELKALAKIKKEELYYWDTVKERATKGSENWETINNYLDDKKSQANKIILN